ncbi:hypothetical protein CTAYLR_001382 [Chrysophaeum taylorii]|uniref:Uncharacterized protein n=1 Tax=Chrysophaeum taylorii TaxID=2483200 RepID=A0AAD7XGL1_9STRA|nr:hypothetical protein CTAYLR_001382 [Chrysophaeum taylorii]
MSVGSTERTPYYTSDIAAERAELPTYTNANESALGFTDASAELPADVSANENADASAELPADACTELPADANANASADTNAKLPANRNAELPAVVNAELPAFVSANIPALVRAELRAILNAELPALANAKLRALLRADAVVHAESLAADCARRRGNRLHANERNAEPRAERRGINKLNAESRAEFHGFYELNAKPSAERMERREQLCVDNIDEYVVGESTTLDVEHRSHALATSATILRVLNSSQSPPWDPCVSVADDPDIQRAALTSNNLGGQGPRAGEAAMRFSGVMTGVDLVVTASEYQAANASFNGKWQGQFAQINVAANTTAYLTFEFTEELSDFVLTFYDLDVDRKQKEQLCVSADAYVLRDTTSLLVEDVECGRQFTATAPGFLCDNPTEDLSLVTCDECEQCNAENEIFFPIDLSERAVMIGFEKTKSFDLALTVLCEEDCEGRGRNFLFGGQSALCAWPSPAPTTVPTPDPWDPCVSVADDPDIQPAALTSNNLGGQGPRAGEAAMRFSGVMTGVDLVVTASEYQAANASFNGKWHGQFAQINVAANTTAYLTFEFTEELSDFVLTFYDLDVDRKQKEQLCVSADAYVLRDTTSLLVEDVECGRQFTATAPGFLCDNPTEDLSLVTCDECEQCNAENEILFPIDLSERAVMIGFEKTKSFDLALTVLCEEDCEGRGRNFLFGGQSALCAWPSPAPTTVPTPDPWDPCVSVADDPDIQPAALTSNNLGGQGPRAGEAAMRFSGVMTGVDLVVTASEYQAANASFNGKWHGQFAQINVAANTTAYLTFEFTEELSDFVLTFYDLDVDRKQKEQLCVSADAYVLRDTTSLLVEDVECGRQFTATAPGFLCDNPTEDLSLVTCDECEQCNAENEIFFPIDLSERAVMIGFEKTKSFDLALTVLCEEDCEGRGRNFLFGGQSALCAWPSPAPTTVPTPDPWDPCVSVADDPDIQPAALTSNNLGGQGPRAGEAAMRFSGVMTGVDLVVTASEYQAANASFNGKWHGQFAQINVAANTTAYLTFEFTEELSDFVLTFYDLDVDRKQKEQLCCNAENEIFFPIDLSERAVMIGFEKTKSFDLALTVLCEEDCEGRGRNFLFGGQSALCAWPSPAPTSGALVYDASDSLTLTTDLTSVNLTAALCISGDPCASRVETFARGVYELTPPTTTLDFGHAHAHNHAIIDPLAEGALGTNRESERERVTDGDVLAEYDVLADSRADFDAVAERNAIT